MTDSQPGPILPVRTLGKTGLEVPGLCVGCAPLGDMPATFTYSVPEERALETIRAIFKSPITFMDTAASYGDGESERRIGIVLKELGGVPVGYTLATKADRDLQTGDFSGDQMRRSVERSLRLLGLDCLPLLYLHDPEYTTFEAAMAPNGPVEVLQRCKEEGLIEHLGVAGGPIDLMTRFVETDIFEAAISHNRYTLLNTEADPFWDVCQRHGVGAVNAAPYGSGILAKGPRAYARYEYDEASREYVEKAMKFDDACQRYHVPLAVVALQFSLRDSRIHSTVIGMSRPERLDETVKLAQTPIPDELWREIESIRLS
ncbi:aldo/keto reductase [Dictyobacter formicarum]|uniref:Oxidoreductase n=1 Tax=Dictyobacter formicarum TaxID=2778368 RepID=A0ABQ3VG36_9CHLR|nr:aldo/keto reductase [Dictyobacter formicarum]GHO85127.1 oxidoreductase [Dictyobacter formicarum]